MSASASVNAINNLLQPYLFQVIGSTPSSVCKSIKSAGLKGEREIGLQLAASCVFAAAVNKTTLEQFLLKPELQMVRPTIVSSFSISGKTNMTGLTLLGHCLMTSNLVDSIVFAKEFRNKMGQNSLWVGDFKSGSLSDKRKEILLEKKRVTDGTQAALLGSGFFKYVGIDNRPWTAEELEFWEETAPTTARKVAPPMSFSGPSTPPRPKNESSAPVTPPRAGSKEDLRVFTFSNGSTHTLSQVAVDYYMEKNNNDRAKLEDSVANRGDTDFNSVYFTAATRGLGAASTIAGGSVTR